MKPRTLLQGLAGLAAWGCLSGLTLIRLWAVLYGHLSGPVILVLAVLLAFGTPIKSLITKLWAKKKA